MTTAKWQFDSNLLNQALSTGIVLLKDPKIPKNRKASIRYDIKNIKRYLLENYEELEYNGTRPPKDKDKLRNYILRKMEKQYKMLGPEFINWIINLSETEIFKLDTESNPERTELSIEEQAELTIENYESHAKEYGVLAKKLILDAEVHQIQLEEDLLGCSYCRHSEIIDLPFLVINPHDAPWILNHEIQHGIQGILKYRTNFIYNELGSIYFEMLFNDLLYKKQKYLHKGDYQERIEDADWYASSLSNYFKTMLIFAESSFQVSQDKFEDAFLTNNDVSPEMLNDYLIYEIASDEKYEDMNYLFSFLKAVELREQTKNLSKNSDSIELLEPLINTKRFKFEHPRDFTLYDRYVKEMTQKTK